MTLAEIGRYIESKKRINKQEAQQKANFDYILADLIGRSISRIYSSTAKLPSIEEAYPTLFDKEEAEQKKQEKINELSVLRFKQFAKSFNNRFREVSSKE